MSGDRGTLARDVRAADAPPALSVVLPTDSWRTIRPVIERLERQTISARLEVVLVVPSAAAAGVERLRTERIGRLVVVEVGDVPPLARARAAGVRAATAPLVFIGETHSYPRAGWAEAIVATAAARPDATVIVPAFGNANPTGALSWSGFLLDYGGWQDGPPGGELSSMPIFNSAYRTAVLHALGDGIELAMGHGDALVVHLRAHGHRVVLAAEARIDHVNVAQTRAWVRERVVTGRVLAANRSRAWSVPRRVAYALAFPLIALVLAARALPSARARATEPAAPRGTVPAMLAASWLKACGEALGYVAGDSRRAEDVADELELHKLVYAARGRS